MMEIDPPINFPTKEDEIRYWIDVAQQMYERKENVERELEEFQENSIILERELETSYEQTDKVNRDLKQRNIKLVASNEELKTRLNQQILVCSTLQKQVQDLTNYNEQLVKCVRRLEQKNDDLERANRETKVSEEEIESQYNMVLEKLALLETETDEKENLEIVVQRLKDENKELKQQIQVDQQQQHSRNVIDINSIILQNRSSVGSFHEESQNEHNQNGNKNLMEYVRELEEKIKYLEKTESSRTKKDIEINMNIPIKDNALLDIDFIETEACKVAVKEGKSKNKDSSQNGKVRLRSKKEKSSEKSSSHSCAKSPAEKQRNSTSSSDRLSRLIDNKVKKVKSEDKRQQNVMWFLKRLRYSQPNWMRSKESDQ